MKQGFKGCVEPGVLLGLPLGWTFRSASGHPVSLGSMALEEKRLDIVLRVGPAVLVQNICFSGKTNGGKTVILSNDDISRADPVHKSIIYTVGTLVKDQGSSALPVYFMGGIAKEKTFRPIGFAQPDGNVYNRTGIGVNKNFHISTSHFDYTKEIHL